MTGQSQRCSGTHRQVLPSLPGLAWKGGAQKAAPSPDPRGHSLLSPVETSNKAPPSVGPKPPPSRAQVKRPKCPSPRSARYIKLHPLPVSHHPLCPHLPGTPPRRPCSPELHRREPQASGAVCVHCGRCVLHGRVSGFTGEAQKHKVQSPETQSAKAGTFSARITPFPSPPGLTTRPRRHLHAGGTGSKSVPAATARQVSQSHGLAMCLRHGTRSALLHRVHGNDERGWSPKRSQPRKTGAVTA